MLFLSLVASAVALSPAFPESTITLSDVVSLALLHSPDLATERANVIDAEGRHLIAAGAFDPLLTGNVEFSFSQSNLTPSTLEDEIDTRSDLRDGAATASSIYDTQQLNASEFSTVVESLNSGGDPNDLTFSDSLNRSTWNLLVAIYNDASGGERSRIIDAMTTWAEVESDASTMAADIAFGNYRDAIDRLRTTGAVPTQERTTDGSVDVSLATKFRVGATVTPFFSLTQSGSNFAGKRRSREYGGTGIDDTYTAKIGVRIDVPLLRHAGSGNQFAADETAAVLSYHAAELEYTQTTEETIGDVVTAYWRLAAANEELDIARSGLAFSSELTRLTERRYQPRLATRSDVHAAAAHEASTRSDALSAERAAWTALENLANLTGTVIESTERIPSVADTLPAPDPLAGSHFDAIVDHQRLAEHRTVRADSLRLEAEAENLHAADRGRRPVLDFGVELSTQSTNYENAFFPGVYDALGGKWSEPGAVGTLSAEYPLGNRAQSGQYLQRLAAHRRAEIQYGESARANAIRYAVLVAELDRFAAASALELSAVADYRSAIGSMTEARQTGARRTLDVIEIERQRLSAERRLVASRLSFLERLIEVHVLLGTLPELLGLELVDPN